MALDPTALTIAFKRGQLDAVVRTHLGAGGLYTTEMQRTFSLRQLSRAWKTYREDRAISMGARLVGSECAAERDAFLALLVRTLPSRNSPLLDAVHTVRRIAIAPLAAEARQSVEIAEASIAQLDAVTTTLDSGLLPTDPLERLLSLVNHHRYSIGNERDALGATALSPCWAINLLALTRPEAFGLCKAPPPFPGIVRRRLFRADLAPDAQRGSARENLLDVMHAAIGDMDSIWRAARRFSVEFPQQRSNSRLGNAWMLLAGLNELTPSQLARALPATKAGAGKLLRQLAAHHLVRPNGLYEPFSWNPVSAAAFDNDLS